MSSVILEPVAVTKDNVKATIIKDGFYKPSRAVHRRVRRRLQGGRDPVATMATESRPAPPRRRPAPVPS